MRPSMEKTLMRLSRSKRGNAMLMTALGLPALLGATGYGVDTAQWYMWQRELQHAVDQAAIGGAWALAYNPNADYRLRATQEFNSNEDLTKAVASTPTITLTSYSGGSDNSVLVSATATRRLPFSGMLFNRSTTVAAQAQAAFAPGTKYNACLITLRKDGTTFTVGGNANVIADCGLGALSCSDDAITIDGSASVQTTSIATCGTASVPANLQGTVSENVKGLSDAYANFYVPEPTGSTPNQTNQAKCNGNGKNAIATLNPGIYDGGYVANCNTTFQPGVYFINGGTLDLSTNAPVVGNGVLFVLQNGATIKWGGQGGSGSLTLSPMSMQQASSTPYASYASQLSQMLVMQDPNTNPTAVNSQINGNTNVNLAGVMYLPKTNLTINGNSDSSSNLCFQISAWTLNILGNAYLKTLCSTDKSTELGTSVAGVRLVA